MLEVHPFIMLYDREKEAIRAKFFHVMDLLSLEKETSERDGKKIYSVVIVLKEEPLMALMSLPGGLHRYYVDSEFEQRLVYMEIDRVWEPYKHQAKSDS